MKQITKLGLVVLLVLAVGAGFALAKSKHDKGWLGVYTQTVDEDLAEAFDLPIDRGAIVNSVVEASPAEKCGIEEDDIIIAVGDDKVYDQYDLIDMIRDREPGDEVTITVLRDDSEKEFSAVVDSWRDEDEHFYFGDSPRKHAYKFSFSGEERPYIGVSLIDVSEELAANLGGEDHGVLINEVVRDSPAEKAGLKAGDLVVAIDGEEVYEADDIQDAIRDLEADEIARLDVIRDKKPQSIEVTVDVREDNFYSGGPHILNIPDLPRIDLDAPRMRGLYRSLDHDFGGFDSREFREDMREMRQELEEVQEELRQLKKQLE